MEYKLYFLEDSYIAELIWDDNFDEFRDVCSSSDDLWHEECFDNERDMDIFICGITYNEDERDMPRFAILRSDNPDHERYIDYLMNL